MIQLCRHIKPEGTQCTASALRGARFCHTHEQLHASRSARGHLLEDTALSAPVPLSAPPLLSSVDLLFPEDRVAIQTNLFRIADALATGRIDLGTANAMTYNMRAALANLGQRPLLASASTTGESAPAKAVDRVILTPEGDRIAPPVEMLEPGESEPVHHRACPCLKCAEKYRNWQGELHHADCACGLCEPIQNPQLVATSAHELTATPLRRATAAALLSPSAERDPLSRPWSVADYTFGDSIRRHEAQYAARAAAALAAGIEPPPYQPFDTGLLDPASEEAAVERERQQRADQLWAAHFRSLVEPKPQAAAAPEIETPAIEPPGPIETPQSENTTGPVPAPPAAPGRLSLVQAGSRARVHQAGSNASAPRLFHRPLFLCHDSLRNGSRCHDFQCHGQRKSTAMAALESSPARTAHQPKVVAVPRQAVCSIPDSAQGLGTQSPGIREQLQPCRKDCKRIAASAAEGQPFFKPAWSLNGYTSFCRPRRSKLLIRKARGTHPTAQDWDQ